MDPQAEVSEFLRSRRARITPEQAGIIGGGRRRVPGLRREEVAMLAGMSIDYYAKMERGQLAGVSTEVLDALARALQLDDAESEHLHDLARAARPAPVRRTARTSAPGVRPSLQRFLDTITGTPTWVRNRQMDIVATNPLGRALLAPVLDDAASRGNNARFTFFNPGARIFYPEWEQGASSIVATLRSDVGRNPHDRELTNLIGELVTRSDDFRLRWAAHDVRHHRTGVKRIVHPEVGELEFTYEGFDLPDNPGWSMYACTAALGSPTQERLAILGSLAATTPAAESTAHRDTGPAA